MTSTQPSLLASSVPTPVQLRAELEDLVERELLGPRRGPDEEIVEGRVQDTYLVGMLVPRNQRMKAGEMDSLAADGAGTVEDGNSDDVSIPTDSLSPSSIGLSCTVSGDTRELHLTARWGRYKREKSEMQEAKRWEGYLRPGRGVGLDRSRGRGNLRLAARTTPTKRSRPVRRPSCEVCPRRFDCAICVERQPDRVRDEFESRTRCADKGQSRARPCWGDD